jgi:hypothetical protein
MGKNPNASQDSLPHPQRWKTILFFAGTAAFGGLAIALWNREELSRIRATGHTSQAPNAVQLDKEIF